MCMSCNYAVFSAVCLSVCWFSVSNCWLYHLNYRAVCVCVCVCGVCVRERFFRLCELLFVEMSACR